MATGLIWWFHSQWRDQTVKGYEYSPPRGSNTGRGRKGAKGGLIGPQKEQRRIYRAMNAGLLSVQKCSLRAGDSATSRPGADTLYYQKVGWFIRAYAPFIAELIGCACVAIGAWGLSRKS
jgi:hypothetical protein